MTMFFTIIFLAKTLCTAIYTAFYTCFAFPLTTICPADLCVEENERNVL
jgi:hypothetical protein